MCGIVGVVTKFKNGFQVKEVNAFTQLLYADQVRGVDGTGMFFNTKQGKGHIRTLRAPIPASSMICKQEFADVEKILFNESNFIIGHNRAATKGTVTAECTHPFREKHITLVHNGTLVSQKELHPTAEVDSHAICHSIVERGAEETLKMIDGAFSLVWFDSLEMTLNLCRNYERPLYIVEYQNCFIISSELELGLWIGSRQSFTFIKSFQLTPKKLYKLNIEKMDTIHEEDVEYKVFQNKMGGRFRNGVWKNHSENVYEDCMPHYTQGLRTYCFGEKVRFKAGSKIYGEDNTEKSFMEGDILKFQYLADGVSPIKTDFEGKFRIKLSGKKGTLDKFLNQDNLIGTVSGSSIRGDKTTYFVTDVMFYTGTQSTKVIPFVKEPENTLQCAWCYSDENVICKSDNGDDICVECNNLIRYQH